MVDVRSKRKKWDSNIACEQGVALYQSSKPKTPETNIWNIRDKLKISEHSDVIIVTILVVP